MYLLMDIGQKKNYSAHSPMRFGFLRGILFRTTQVSPERKTVRGIWGKKIRTITGGGGGDHQAWTDDLRPITVRGMREIS